MFNPTPHQLFSEDYQKSKCKIQFQYQNISKGQARFDKKHKKKKRKGNEIARLDRQHLIHSNKIDEPQQGPSEFLSGELLSSCALFPPPVALLFACRETASSAAAAAAVGRARKMEAEDGEWFRSRCPLSLSSSFYLVESKRGVAIARRSHRNRRATACPNQDSTSTPCIRIN